MSSVEGSADDKAKIVVRDGVQADLLHVAALKVESWVDTYAPIVGSAVIDRMLDVEEQRSSIQRDLENHGAFLLVAAAPNGEIVGFALNHLDAGEPFLESLHVRPVHRGSGIGTALLRATATHWTASGFNNLSLHVVSANAAARRLYERLGAVDIGTTAENWKGVLVPTAIYRWPSLSHLV
jgi:ribosomal protein S18 acetylase RimI-like enzyme